MTTVRAPVFHWPTINGEPTKEDYNYLVQEVERFVEYALEQMLALSTGEGSGTVSSVFGRDGAVTAQAGDYTAAKITTTSNGGLIASDLATTLTNIAAELGDFGTMALQDADNVAITGGTIDGTDIGQTTPAEGTFL